MRITYNAKKRADTFEERGLDFEEASIVFNGETIEIEDTRLDYGEVRTQTIGFLAGRMVMVVWTQDGDEARRVFSMRKCNAKEQSRYQKRFEARRRARDPAGGI
jgi:uncharacterized DUF497 family protein